MKKIIILSLAIATFLSGCSLISTGEMGDENISKADQTLDDYHFNLATQARDAERCEQILEAELESECLKTVESFTITELAKGELDKGMCDDIELERYKANCVIEVERMIVEAEVEAKYEEGKAADMELQIKASESQDVKICEEIKMESTKNSCIYNIVANQAIAAKDESLCKEIKDEVMIAECKKSVQGLAKIAE